MAQRRNVRRHRQRNARAEARRRALRSKHQIVASHGRSMLIWNIKLRRVTHHLNPETDNAFDIAFGVPDPDDEALADQFRVQASLVPPQVMSEFAASIERPPDMIGDEMLFDMFCDHIRDDAAANFGLAEADGLREAMADPDTAGDWLVLVTYRQATDA